MHFLCKSKCPSKKRSINEIDSLPESNPSVDETIKPAETDLCNNEVIESTEPNSSITKVNHLAESTPSIDEKANHEHYNTLHIVHKNELGIYISEFHSKTMDVPMFSDDIEYTHGQKQLSIGDEVYVAIKKNKFILFTHYKIMNLKEKENSKIIFSEKIYTWSNVHELKGQYKTFIKAFLRRHDLHYF